ncbi:heavy metal translocatin [Trichodelitschia bisporula]|uniref:Heavy metal translocatin n=1 Tax=Trichodelitschia bisporula TaxID=703511 RepID=A0A6G1HXI6_9PEZI|nr:heavy metal translocatin [Trichodelitschia bisporula]
MEKHADAQGTLAPHSGGRPASWTTTTLFISNLHCPSCVKSIEQTLGALGIPPERISCSIISHSVTVQHLTSVAATAIQESIEAGGFEVHSIFEGTDLSNGKVTTSSLRERYGQEWADSLDDEIQRWRQIWRLLNSRHPQSLTASRGPSRDSTLLRNLTAEIAEGSNMGKQKVHAEQCSECQAEAAGVAHGDLDGVPLTQLTPPLAHSDSVNTLTSSAPGLTAKPSEDTIAVDGGNGKPKASVVVMIDDVQEHLYHADISIVGMTCSACVAAITHAVEPLPFVRSINVALLTNSATVVFEGKERAVDVVQTIEDCGFDATVEHIEEVRPKEKSKAPQESDMWKATYAIGGMTCSACVGNVTNSLSHHPFIEKIDINLISNSGTVIFRGKENASAITEAIEDAGYDATLDSIVNISTQATVDIEREVFLNISGMYCHHCPNKVQSALQEKYGRNIEIVKAATTDDPIMKIKYLARPPEFSIRNIIATIDQIDEAFITTIHHPPTIEDRSRAMLARERTRILLRLALSVTAAIPAFIIGVVCMQLLMHRSEIRMFMMHPVWAGSVSRAEWSLFILATPIYFFAADTFHRRALKELKAMWRPGSPVPIHERFFRFGSMNMLMSLGTTIAYFSSVAQLAIAATQEPMEMEGETMMSGENYFDSVIFLTMFLLMGRFIEAYSKAKTGDAVASLGALRPTEAILIEEADVSGRKLSVDLLDVGDTVLVQHGMSPPFDGTVVDGSTKFDESSLTGESMPVRKEIGDQVFSGTVNRGSPVSVRLTSVSGTSMLDQIIKIVREGQTKRAPVERVADMVTSHFVPFVVLVGVSTWIVWLSLGLGGVLPAHWLSEALGGWPLWSLKFAIAVFVVACPCGIGLAAPTALFVGGGMAAKHGILVKGGGEAFQEASTLDCIVFDKTGTLTSGGDPSVTDHKLITDDDEKEVLGMIKRLEENSGHPIAKAIVEFCALHSDHAFIATDIGETPGKGMIGKFRLDEGNNAALDVEVIIGNETLMTDHGVGVDASTYATLQFWKRQGKSVVLVALKASDPFADPKKARWILTAIFAVADQLRPEARPTVQALRERGVDVWMLSGDNVDTARAVGEMVGIKKENIIAGVLPDQKAERIQWLQKTLPKPSRRPRATVAMVGDGINDSPALTMADVGIAIGSGSDVALSSAEFVLIKSDLESILTLIDLSRTVFRRVWFNFGWALVYNLIAMPVAAGVFYPIVSQGKHVRLDPVWASLAMALSSGRAV